MNHNPEELLGQLTPRRVRSGLRSRLLSATAKELRKGGEDSASYADDVAMALRFELDETPPSLPQSSDKLGSEGIELDPNFQSPVVNPDLVVDPVSIVIRTGSVPTSPPPLFSYVTQVGPFSYLVSAVIMCVATLVAWQYEMADRPLSVRIQGRHLNSAVAEQSSKPAYAGYVSDMDGCQWDHDVPVNDGEPTPQIADLTVSSQVSSGRQICIDSGLLEITYRFGAKVLLQGPATFEIDDHGGFLAAGKLAGKLEREFRGSNSQSPIPNPFVIHTPTAVITDLGTEFGVEVDDNGGTTSVVFRGAIKVHPGVLPGDGRDMVLKANEAASVNADIDRSVTINRVDVASNRFVRNIRRGERGTIDVHSTGLGLKKGDRDPWWQVVAATGDPRFQPEAALVVPARKYWGGRSSHSVQWVSTTAGPKNISPKNSTYTFRTTFDLTEMLPETAIIEGWCMVDANLVDIRLNGRSVPLPESNHNLATYGHGLTLDQGFVNGVNFLEVEVRVGEPTALNQYELSPLGLQMTLNGTARWKP